MRCKILVAVIALLTLIACQQPAPPPDTLTLAMPKWYAPDRVPAVAQALADFTARSGKTVAPKILVGKREAMQQKIMLGASRGDFADAALVRNEWLGTLRAANALKPLPPALAAQVREQVLPALLPAVTTDHAVWAAPFDADARVVWYRTDQAALAGLSPAMIWTTDDFTALAKALSHDKPAFAFSAQRYPHAALTFLPWYLVHGGRLVDDAGRPTLDPPAAAAALTWLQGLVRDKIAPTGVAALEQNDVFSGLAGGVYTVTIGGSWERDMLARQSQLGDDIACLPVPGRAGRPGATVLGGWSLVLLAGGRDDAAGLIAALLAPEPQSAKLRESGLLPTLRAVLDDPWFVENRDGPTLRFALEHAQTLPLHVGTAALTDEVATMLAEVFLGKKTPEQGARDAADRLATALAR